ncbi:MAG: PQQ-binding-like beta-propeller repeat protein [Planctomycetales bacterium]
MPAFRVACLLSAAVLAFAPGCGAAEEDRQADASAVGTLEYRPAERGDWPWWRGPHRDNAAPGERVPVEWSDTKNVVWKAPVPGRGHASPCVVKDRVVLATADEEREIQGVVAFDRATGRQSWRSDLHRGGFDGELHRKNTQASPTVASDGERFFAAFLNAGNVILTALDFDGKQLWQTTVEEDFDSYYGYSASPTIHGNYVIVAADHQGGGCLAAVDRRSGEIAWKTNRPAEVTYASPIVLALDGRDQLPIAGANRVASYDPATGKQLWSVAGTTKACVGTAVQAGDLVFASGGYPGKETVCMRADGSGEVVWRNGVKAYVPSMLVRDGCAYLVTDNGVLYCWDAETGKEHWKQRLGGGDVSASPVLAGEHIHVSNEAGTTFVIKPGPARFELVAQNQLGDEAFATPAVCGDRIYLRVADGSTGRRQESLYCIGSAPAE